MPPIVEEHHVMKPCHIMVIVGAFTFIGASLFAGGVYTGKEMGERKRGIEIENTIGEAIKNGHPWRFENGRAIEIVPQKRGIYYRAMMLAEEDEHGGIRPVVKKQEEKRHVKKKKAKRPRQQSAAETDQTVLTGASGTNAE